MAVFKQKGFKKPFFSNKFQHQFNNAHYRVREAHIYFLPGNVDQIELLIDVYSKRKSWKDGGEPIDRIRHVVPLEIASDANEFGEQDIEPYLIGLDELSGAVVDDEETP